MSNQIVKTVITFTVLHRADNPMTDYSIDQVLSETNEGDAVGWETDRTSQTIPPEQVVDELIALGNDGTFFEEV